MNGTLNSRLDRKSLYLSLLLTAFVVLPAKRVVAQRLTGKGLSATFQADGRLIGLTNELNAEHFQVSALPFAIDTDAGSVTPVKAGAVQAQPAGLTVVYETTRPVEVTVRYELPPSGSFLTKTITIRNNATKPLVVKKIVANEIEFSSRFDNIHPHRDPSEFRWLINVFLRSKAGGLYAGIENPVYDYWTKGGGAPKSWIQLSYDPRAVIEPGQAFVASPAFIGAFRKEGVYVFKELGKLRRAVNIPNAIPSLINFDQEILDWGEVWAMQDFMLARQPPRDSHRPGFYVRVVAMVGGNKTAAMGSDSGFHIAFKPQHVESSKRFVDEIAALGHIPHIEWATEWFGNTGYARPSENFHLENAGPSDPMPVNPYWQEVVRYGLAKGLRSGIFETISRNFARRKSEWKVMRHDGTPWVWNSRADPMNCWANPEYVAWRLQTTDRAIREHDLYMVAWDAYVPADWSWLGWPVLETECWAKNHGHLPGDIRQPLFRNITWFLEEIQQKQPKAALRVASGLTTFYPWALKNLIEYHPNFYDGETGATYWTSYNFRFLPMYKSGVLLSATSKQEFEWLLLRSISVSDHFMLWPDAVNIARENKPFWDKWLSWADRNIAYLRVGRTLFREPWGDKIVASLPPALEGRLPADTAGLHGSAHIIGDRGFIFLFNPSSSTRAGTVPVNHWIGLESGETFSIRVIHPTEQTYGPFRRGDELRIEVPAQGALVLDVTPSNGSSRRPFVAATTPVDKAFLKWDEIPWKEIEQVP